MKLIDGHDNAFIGMTMLWRENGTTDVSVYSGEKIIENLMAQGMTEHQAIEYCAFNIEGAYVGEDTPVIVWNSDLQEAIEMYAPVV